MTGTTAKLFPRAVTEIRKKKCDGVFLMASHLCTQIGICCLLSASLQLYLCTTSVCKWVWYMDSHVRVLDALLQFNLKKIDLQDVVVSAYDG